MDFIFRTKLFISNNQIENIDITILFKDCDDYDISKIKSLENKSLQCDIKSLLDHVYSYIDDKNYIIEITVQSLNVGYSKVYQPQNISVISKDNTPKGIMINDTAEVYNINNIPEDIKNKLIHILTGTELKQDNISNQIPENTNIASNQKPDIPPEKPNTGDRSSLRMSPSFNDIFQSTLNQMSNIKPSDGLINEIQHVGDKDWIKIKTQIDSLKGDSNASTT